MTTIALFVLQVSEIIPIDNSLWAVLREVGGAAGILFGFVVIILWRDNKAKDLQIQELNSQGREDAKEGARLMASLEVLIENLLIKYETGEKRIVASVEREVRSIKAEIHAYKQKLDQKAKSDGGDS